METDKEKEFDSTFRSGAAFVVAGFLIIAAIWYVFLRPSEERAEQPPTIPIAVAKTNATIFELTPGLSSIRFEIDEVLRGQPVTVLGLTRLVSGQIALDPANLSTAQVGIIQANALSFYTDDAFRDEALHTFIIDSQTYPLITFTPMEIEGLPEQIVVGETAVFTLTGDLTIRDITRTVAFDCSAKLISAARLEGRATTTISRADFDLAIPEVPQVASVAENFSVEIEIVAEAVGEE
jgi:polyisoprenoid-binding protein YceI